MQNLSQLRHQKLQMPSVLLDSLSQQSTKSLINLLMQQDYYNL